MPRHGSCWGGFTGTREDAGHLGQQFGLLDLDVKEHVNPLVGPAPAEADKRRGTKKTASGFWAHFPEAAVWLGSGGWI
ncbi:MAG: hypothetical protein JW732_03670 [Dehalococcoidia bacterium]|nr:hypothetical protein [Dehalococcoidia bacterium]